jgi:anti-anti-sigma factor
MSELLSHEPTVEVRWPRPGTALVLLGGEHDLATATTLDQTLKRVLDGCTHLIVDLSDTEFLDSSTIRAIVMAKKHSDATGKTFNLLLASTPIVERALEIAGVLSSLNRVRTINEALNG